MTPWEITEAMAARSGTKRALWSAIMQHHAVDAVLIHESEGVGSVTVWIIGTHAAEFETGIYLLAEQQRPAGIELRFLFFTPWEFQKTHETLTERTAKLESVIARYEELAPDLKAADATLEVLKKETPISRRLTINEVRAESGLPPLSANGDILTPPLDGEGESGE